MADSEKVEMLIKDPRTLLKFVKNPHREKTKAHEHYLKIKGAASVKDAKAHGATVWDLRKWHEVGAIEFSGGGEMKDFVGEEGK
eukprot:2841578-Karenia_brevis.AAC.1